MRWFKHMTATRQDEKIALMIAKYGPVSYAYWWMVFEAVALQVEKGGTKNHVTYHVTTWSQVLSVRGSHVRQCLEMLAVSRVVTVVWDQDMATVTIPNLLKYRDEYTSRVGTRSGHSPEQEQIQIQIQKQIQKQRQNKQQHPQPLAAPAPQAARGTPSPKGHLTEKQKSWFAEFWAVYWRRQARGAAECSFGKRVKTEEDFRTMLAAVLAQAPEYTRREMSKRPHASTWINQERWRDEPEHPPLCMEDARRAAQDALETEWRAACTSWLREHPGKTEDDYAEFAFDERHGSGAYREQLEWEEQRKAKVANA